MEYRTLGSTGLKVSVIGMGTWQLAGPMTLDGKADGFPDPGENQVLDLIRRCRDELGINLIDTAEQYGDGQAERRVGKAIAGDRQQWIISTKFGMRRGAGGERISHAAPETIRSSLEKSLERLKTDYVDIYLYHARPEKSSIEAGREVLESLRQEGKLRFYGISTQRRQLIETMARQNAAEVILFGQSLLTRPDEIIDVVEKRKLGGMVRRVLEGGKLSGRYFRSAPQFGPEDIRQHWYDQAEASRYKVYEELLPPGMTMTDLAIRYVLDFPTSHTLVMGGTSLDHYHKAARAAALPPLDDSLHDQLEAIRRGFLAEKPPKTLLGKLRRWVARLG